MNPLLPADYTFSYFTGRAGQQGAFQDSIYEYEINSTFPLSVVQTICTNYIHPCPMSVKERRKKMSQETETMGTYFSPSWELISTKPHKYTYRVTIPYTG